MLYLPVKPSYNKIDKKSYIKVRSCYYISVSNEMLYSRRFLESCELMYVMSGRIYISADGVEYTIGENEVLILPRYKVVSSVKRTDYRTRFCTVEFICSDDVIYPLAGAVVPVLSDSVYFRELVSSLEQSFTGADGDDSFQSDAVLLTMLYEIRKNYERCVKNMGNKDLSGDVMKYVDENIDKIISVDEIAEHFSYSKDYLIRRFREQSGYTLKKYINEKKMNITKRLLTSTEMSVEKVGGSIGYDDIDLFIKFFKYHEGITPSKYRKINK